MPLSPLAEPYAETRDNLHQVAVHVLARALSAATGHIGLRPTQGGFGTPQFGPDRRRLRISGGVLVVEAGGPPSLTRALPIDGSSLADLASFAAVDLGAADFSVGHDTPPLGDPDQAMRIDRRSVVALASWYALVARALDAVVATVPTWTSPTLAQLWPEHFDVGLDLAVDPVDAVARRVNLGGSPGDGFHSDPYLYVGPWTDDRPGDPAAWNAPFGAIIGYVDMVEASNPVDTTVDFFRSGLERLGL